jgi:hypothetical protein
VARVKKEYEEKQRRKKEKEKEAEKKGDKDKEKDEKSDDKKKKDEKPEIEVSVRDPGVTVFLLTLSLRKPRTVNHQNRKRSRGCLS